MPGVPVLAAEHLTLRFGGLTAARDVNLSVANGEILAIIGQNGAGKSTFLNMCSGAQKPESGDIRIEGRSIIGLKPREIVRLGVARAFQHPQLFREHRVIDHLRFASATRGSCFWHPFHALVRAGSDDDVAELLHLFDLTGMAELPAGNIPEGARKLLDIAMAFALKPRLILLDEPTSGVASDEKEGVMTRLIAALRARGVSAVFVEHDMEVVARFADRVAVWSEGELFRIGEPAEILSDPEVGARVL